MHGAVDLANLVAGTLVGSLHGELVPSRGEALAVTAPRGVAKKMSSVLMSRKVCWPQGTICELDAQLHKPVALFDGIAEVLVCKHNNLALDDSQTNGWSRGTPHTTESAARATHTNTANTASTTAFISLDKTDE